MYICKVLGTLKIYKIFMGKFKLYIFFLQWNLGWTPGTPTVLLKICPTFRGAGLTAHRRNFVVSTTIAKKLSSSYICIVYVKGI